MFLSTISSNQILAVRRIELEHIAVALRLKTDAKAGGRKKFVYSHIDNCRSLSVTCRVWGFSFYIIIGRLGGVLVAGVEGGSPLWKMMVGWSGISERGISRDIAFRPCPVGEFPAISHSACAKDIVE